MVYYIGSILCAPSDLQHWGIKGQKWGVRRFRNPDGTLTDAGKARYALATGKKNPLDMTDKELQSAVNRLRNEQAWRSLVKELDKKPPSKGREAAGKIMKTFGDNILWPFTKTAASAAGKAIVDLMKEETSAQNADAREAEKKKKEKANEEARKAAEEAAEEKRRKAREEALWDEDRFD